MRGAAFGVAGQEFSAHGFELRIGAVHPEGGLEQGRPAMARGGPERLERKGGEAAGDAHVVHGASEVGGGVDERAVEVEEKEVRTHGAGSLAVGNG